LTDLCGVFVGILLQSFSTGYTDILYILTGTLIMFFFWYIFALYLPISAMTLLLYHGKEIPTLFGRFLIEVGVFVVHSGVAIALIIGKDIYEKDSTIFFIGWLGVFLCNLLVFMFIERKYSKL